MESKKNVYEVYSSSDSSNSDGECALYSNTAKRFKHTKEKLFPTGVVHLVDKSAEGGLRSSRKRSPSPVEVLDSSDEDIFRDVTAKKDVDDEEEEENAKGEIHEQVEECIQLSPDHISCEPYEHVATIERVPSSASGILLDESDEDPLAFDPLNDSETSRPPDDDNEVVTVKVRLASTVHRIDMTRAQYFKFLIQELAKKLDLDPSKITLEYQNELLDPYGTLKTVPIGITDIIEAVVVSEGIAVSTEDMIELKVQSQARNSQVVISVCSKDSMSVLMQKYADATGVDRSKLSFKFDGEFLEADDTPASLDMEGGECIDVFIKE